MLREFLKPNFKKAVIFVVLFIFSFLILFLIFGTTKFYFVIAGDAMSPNYNRYDRVFVKKVEFNDLKIEDVITFSNQAGNVLIGKALTIDYDKKTLSVVAGNNESLAYGENLPSNSIIGKVVGKTPYLFDLLYGNFLIRLVIFYLLSCLISLGFKKKANNTGSNNVHYGSR